jgi:hypothetical protein
MPSVRRAAGLSVIVTLIVVIANGLNAPWLSFLIYTVIGIPFYRETITGTWLKAFGVYSVQSLSVILVTVGLVLFAD